MSDIIDLIRTKLAAAPLTPEGVDQALLEARMEYAGDMVYIRRPKVRDVVRMDCKRPPVRRPA